MKKVLALAVLLTAVAVGCSSKSDTTSSTQTTFKRSTTTTLSQSSLMNTFLDLMSDLIPGGTRSEYISLGKTSCDTIDRLGSVDAVVTEIVRDPTINSYEANDLAYILGISIPVFCPEYASEVRSFR